MKFKTLKRINCKEAVQMFGSIPGTETIEEAFPQYVKGWAHINAETGAVGYGETEEIIIRGCELLHSYFGHKTFFLYATHGHHKADWTFCGAMIEV